MLVACVHIYSLVYKQKYTSQHQGSTNFASIVSKVVSLSEDYPLKVCCCSLAAFFSAWMTKRARLGTKRGDMLHSPKNDVSCITPVEYLSLHSMRSVCVQTSKRLEQMPWRRQSMRFIKNLFFRFSLMPVSSEVYIFVGHDWYACLTYPKIWRYGLNRKGEIVTWL